MQIYIYVGTELHSNGSHKQNSRHFSNVYEPFWHIDVIIA